MDLSRQRFYPMCFNPTIYENERRMLKSFSHRVWSEHLMRGASFNGLPIMKKTHSLGRAVAYVTSWVAVLQVDACVRAIDRGHWPQMVAKSDLSTSIIHYVSMSMELVSTFPASFPPTHTMPIWHGRLKIPRVGKSWGLGFLRISYIISPPWCNWKTTTNKQTW